MNAPYLLTHLIVMNGSVFRMFLAAAFSGLAIVSMFWAPVQPMQSAAFAAEAEPGQSLSIGSAAPALDIEHWVHDGKGFFPKVTTFDAGKVYVVEFWATWCGPCVASMPHLSELQQKYRGRDVQIVSVSDEPLETVEAFLKREATDKKGEPTTFNEITSAYCLTSDPDRSVYESYMDAANQNGIPTAFIVGKNGLVEWIGHPSEMDMPLEQVVADAWDRDAFKKMYEAEQKFEAVVQSISMLAGTGKFAEAVALINEQLESDLPDAIRQRWIEIRNRVKVGGGMIDEEVVGYFKKQLAESKGDPVGIARTGWMFYQMAQEQKGLEELISASIQALEPEVDAADEEVKPVIFDALAHLYEANGQLDAAIETQEKAVALVEGRTKERLSRYLEQLRSQKKPAEDSETDAASEAAK